MQRWVLVSLAVYLTASVAIALWLLPSGRERSPVTFAAPAAKTVWPLTQAAPD